MIRMKGSLKTAIPQGKGSSPKHVTLVGGKEYDLGAAFEAKLVSDGDATAVSDAGAGDEAEVADKGGEG